LKHWRSRPRQSLASQVARTRPRYRRRRQHLVIVVHPASRLPPLLGQHARVKIVNLLHRESRERARDHFTRALRPPKRSPPKKHRGRSQRRQEGHGGEADGEDSSRQPPQQQRQHGSKPKPPTKRSRRTKRRNDGRSKYGATLVHFAALVRPPTHIRQTSRSILTAYSRR
jgi:hypothetical protein